MSRKHWGGALLAATSTFVYEAQTAVGQTLRGTLDAESIDQASAQLQSLNLRVTRLEPSAHPPQPRAFRSEDFVAFNQQLAQLTMAGIPLERGLRLIASELSSRRQAAAINQIAGQLEAGATLDTAFDSHRGAFPPLYGKLLEAGVRSGSLPGMLLSFGRHAEMIQRLRGAVWRAGSYPLMVLVSLLLVMGFIWGWIIPRLPIGPDPNSFLFVPRRAQTAPLMASSGLMTGAMYLSCFVMATIVLLLVLVLVLWLVGRTRAGSRWVESMLLPIPLVGPILRCSLLARWCDALHLGVRAGLDLPASLALASDAVDSRPLRFDSELLTHAVTQGKAMDANIRLRLLPAIVPASLQLGVEQHDLPGTAATLARMYEEQTATRLNILPATLSPLLLLLVAVCVGAAVVATLLPLVQVIRGITQ